jgi:hypothetical protein
MLGVALAAIMILDLLQDAYISYVMHNTYACEIKSVSDMLLETRVHVSRAKRECLVQSRKLCGTYVGTTYDS